METNERLVPDEVIPHRNLPPLRYRDMPEPIGWKAMVGPSIILAGLSLGSGEFVIWPHIAYKAGFVFFWACLLGVLTQFFLNMEIERWTLLTGESAITGFCRLSKQWAWIFLILNIVPWAWPGWATGAAKIISWLVFGVHEGDTPSSRYEALYVNYLGIAGLILVGVVLTAGPVVYNTVERIQIWLVGSIFVLIVFLAFLVVRPYAITEMAKGAINIGGMPSEDTGISLIVLLGALAFAGAGGTTNLGQSNYIKDKGYGMGKYIGRITSPITGQPEPTAEIGYHFEHTPENIQRWQKWWRAANIEHLFSFFFTCIACLVLLSLITYSLCYQEDGTLKPGMEQFGAGMDFIWGQAQVLGEQFGHFARLAFLLVGVAVLLTTELGVLDTVARINTDIVKVNYLESNEFWTQSRLYYLFLWGEIAFGCAILSFGFKEPLLLIRTSAALNGAVMMVYSLLLLYLNTKILSRSLAITPMRFVAMVWSCAFFGYFTIKATQYEVIPWLQQVLGG